MLITPGSIGDFGGAGGTCMVANGPKACVGGAGSVWIGTVWILDAVKVRGD